MKKKIPENENPDKLIGIVKKTLDFLISNKMVKERKLLSPKQMLQRLPIASARVKARNTSENLLNEIWQIIYSLYRVKEITENIYIENNEFNKIILQNEYYIYEF